MSKPISKSVIGAFVVGAIALLLVAIAIFGSGRFFAKRPVVVMFFQGSVKGLSVGAPVMFRGVPIGNVTDIEIVVDRKDRTVVIPVYAEFDPMRFQERGLKGERFPPLANLKESIAAGMRAQLELQSFVTGQLMINVDFYPDTPVVLVGAEPGTPEIPTIPSSMQRLVKKFEDLPIEEIAQNVNTAVMGVSRLVNSPEVAKAIADVSQAANELKGLVGNMNRQMGPLVATVDQSVKKYGKLADDTGQELGKARQAIEETLGDVRTLVRDTDAQVAPTAGAVRETLRDVRTLVRSLDAQVSSVAATLNETAKEYGTLARTVDGEVPALSTRLQQVLGDVQVTLAKLRDALGAAEGALGGDSSLRYDITSTLSDISAAARAIRQLADSVNRDPESLLRGRNVPGGQ
jgi:paraquat-inducible protein B